MIVIADPDEAFRAWAVESVDNHDEALPTADLSEAEVTAATTANNVTVLVLGPNNDPEDSLVTIERVQETSPEVASVVILADADARLMQAAVRAGARDVLTYPTDSDELLAAVKRAEDLSRQYRERIGTLPSTESHTESRVITVFSTKGGSGKSLVSSNLAILLAELTDAKTALVDLDLQSGDLAIMFQLQPARGIFEASESYERLDAEAIAGYLTPHRAGLSVLTAPLEPSLAESVSADAVRTIVEILRETFPYTIVDGPAFFTDQVLATFDVSDEIVLVGSLDVPSVKNLRLALTTLEQLGIPRTRMKIVLNRADSKVGLRVRDVEKSLGTSIDIAIPSSRDVPLSINEGTPLAMTKRKSPVVQAIAELAEMLRLPEPVEPDNSRRFFGRGS